MRMKLLGPWEMLGVVPDTCITLTKHKLLVSLFNKKTLLSVSSFDLQNNLMK